MNQWLVFPSKCIRLLSYFRYEYLFHSKTNNALGTKQTYLSNLSINYAYSFDIKSNFMHKLLEFEGLTSSDSQHLKNKNKLFVKTEYVNKWFLLQENSHIKLEHNLMSLTITNSVNWPNDCEKLNWVFNFINAQSFQSILFRENS